MSWSNAKKKETFPVFQLCTTHLSDNNSNSHGWKILNFKKRSTRYNCTLYMEAKETSSEISVLCIFAYSWYFIYITYQCIRRRNTRKKTGNNGIWHWGTFLFYFSQPICLSTVHYFCTWCTSMVVNQRLLLHTTRRHKCIHHNVQILKPAILRMPLW